jgi:hypothetical protein
MCIRDSFSSFAFVPLYYRASAPGVSRTQLVNLWWQDDAQQSSFAFFPLYFRYANAQRSGHLVLNTWWSGGQRLERFVFFPLAWYHSPTPAERNFTLFPLLNYAVRDNGSSSFSLLWRLYYQRHDIDGDLSSVLWWLYRSEQRPGFERLMVWPLVDYERNTGATDEVFTSILLRAATYERSGARTRFKLFGVTLSGN